MDYDFDISSKMKTSNFFVKACETMVLFKYLAIYNIPNALILVVAQIVEEILCYFRWLPSC